MAIGDKKPVVMQSDRAVPSGIATLGIDGKLLDAQIPSLAKLGAAPAGYGLGSDASGTDDFNTCVNNGWYCGFGALNAPSFATYASYGLLLVLKQSGTLIVQIYYAYLPKNGIPNLTVAMRTSADSGASWTEWEYDNPPMELGKEYRTTERYNSKPVYVKSVSLGYMPNTTTKTVAHGAQGISYVISVYGHMNDVYMASGSHYGYISNVWADNTNIYVKTTADLSSMFGYVVLKYVK